MSAGCIEIVLLHGGEELARYSLAPGEYTVGRAKVSSIRVPVGLVSRTHARLVVGEKGSVEVEDLGSANGTRLGGTPVSALTTWAPEVELQVGDVTIRMESHEPDKPAHPKAVKGDNGRRPSGSVDIESLEDTSDLSPLIRRHNPWHAPAPHIGPAGNPRAIHFKAATQPVRVADAPASKPKPVLIAKPFVPPPPRNKRVYYLAAGIAAGVLLLGGGVWLYTHRPEPPPMALRGLEWVDPFSHTELPRDIISRGPGTPGKWLLAGETLQLYTGTNTAVVIRASLPFDYDFRTLVELRGDVPTFEIALPVRGLRLNWRATAREKSAGFQEKSNLPRAKGASGPYVFGDGRRHLLEFAVRSWPGGMVRVTAKVDGDTHSVWEADSAGPEWPSGSPQKISEQILLGGSTGTAGTLFYSSVRLKGAPPETSEPPSRTEPAPAKRAVVPRPPTQPATPPRPAATPEEIKPPAPLPAAHVPEKKVTYGEWQNAIDDPALAKMPGLERNGPGLKLTKRGRVVFANGPSQDGAVRMRVRFSPEMAELRLFVRYNPTGNENGGASFYQVGVKPNGELGTLQRKAKEKFEKADAADISGNTVRPADTAEIELRVSGADLLAKVNGTVIGSAKDFTLTNGTMGFNWSRDEPLEIESLEYLFLEPVTPTEPPKPAPSLASTAKPAAPMATEPLPPPVGEKKPEPSAELVALLAKADEQFRAPYERDVVEPFDARVAEVRQRYGAAIARALEAASSSEEASASVRQERQRFLENRTDADDVAKIPESLRAEQISYRRQMTQLAQERVRAAKTYYDRYEQALSAASANLTGAQKVEDTALLQARRDEIKGWVTAPAVAAAPAPVVKTNALASTGTAPVSAAPSAKVAPREAAEWVFNLGGEVYLTENNREARAREFKALNNPRATVTKVILQKDKLQGEVTAEDLQQLAALKELEILEVKKFPFDETVLRFLPALRELRQLSLEGPAWGDRVVDQALACRKLHTLRVSYSPAFTGKQLEQLSKLPDLRSLELPNCPIKDDAAAHVAKLLPLRRLILDRTEITDASILMFSRLPELEELGIAQTKVGLTGLQALRGCHKLEILSFLDAQSASYGDAVRALAAFPRLKELRVKGAPVGANHLAELQPCRALVRLGLGGATLGPDALSGLTKLTALERLDLSNTNLTDDQIGALAVLKNLKRLTLNGTKVTDAALARLKANKGLKELSLTNVPAISQPAIDALEKHLPGLKVWR